MDKSHCYILGKFPNSICKEITFNLKPSKKDSCETGVSSQMRFNMEQAGQRSQSPYNQKHQKRLLVNPASIQNKLLEVNKKMPKKQPLPQASTNQLTITIPCQTRAGFLLLNQLPEVSERFLTALKGTDPFSGRVIQDHLQDLNSNLCGKEFTDCLAKYLIFSYSVMTRVH